MDDIPPSVSGIPPAVRVMQRGCITRTIMVGMTVLPNDSDHDETTLVRIIAPGYFRRLPLGHT